ncbi:MAG: NADH-quinone oxidoreductase subunit A [Bdellovibrionota bacterium]
MILQDYLGVVILLVLGVLTGVGAILASQIFGTKRYYPAKTSAYECGIPSEGAENTRFSVKFYLVAVSFILFDIETIFLVPWAILFRDFVAQGEGLYLFVVGFVFIFALSLGLIYEWRKGLLDWNR